MDEFRPTPRSLRWFLIPFFALAAAYLLIGHDLIFSHPLAEVGDLASNSLRVEQAKHFSELYGNYSRFGFQHPGPAFFYLYALGETLFNTVLGVVPAPHNAQLLTGVLLQAGFLSFAIGVLAVLVARSRGLFVALAVGLAVLNLHYSADLELSVWPPCVLVGPFVCFVTVAIAIACGWLRLLPALVIAGGFLVHGHVAQPLFVLPLGAAAYAAAFYRLTRPGERSLITFFSRRRGVHLASLAILGVFLLPLAIDASHGGSSNLDAIFNTFSAPRGPQDNHSLSHAIAYVVAFLAYPVGLSTVDFSPGQLVSYLGDRLGYLVIVLAVIAILPAIFTIAASKRRAESSLMRKRSFQSVFYLFWLFALALTLVWTLSQRGPLYQFNSFFIYGLIYVGAFPAALYISQLAAGRRAWATAAAVAVATVVFAAGQPPPRSIAENPGGYGLAQATDRLLARHPAPSSGVYLVLDPKDWGSAAAVALELQRRGVQWYVAPQLSLLFLSSHVLADPGSPTPPPSRWFLGEPTGGGQKGETTLSPSLAYFNSPPGHDGAFWAAYRECEQGAPAPPAAQATRAGAFSAAEGNGCAQ